MKHTADEVYNLPSNTITGMLRTREDFREAVALGATDEDLAVALLSRAAGAIMTHGHSVYPFASHEDSRWSAAFGMAVARAHFDRPGKRRLGKKLFVL